MLSFFTYYADYSVPIPEEPGNIVIEDCEICGADRFLHYNFSGNETWQRYRPLRDITFKNIKATDVAMPISLYGTAEHKVELNVENVSIRMRKGSACNELIRACHHKRISIDGLDVEGFTGECLVRTRSDGDVAIKNLTCQTAPAAQVLHTDEEFQIKRI